MCMNLITVLHKNHRNENVYPGIFSNISFNPTPPLGLSDSSVSEGTFFPCST